MPPALDTAMFVNSGSEANDLAWRLATTATGGRGGIVTEWAYHGVSAAIADLSPEEWPRGQPPHVATIPPPDTYRRAPAGARDGRAPPGPRARPPAWTTRWPASPPGDLRRPPSSSTAASPATASSPRRRPTCRRWFADPRCRGALRGRRGPGWPRPDGRRPLELRAAGIVPDVVTLPGKPMGNGHPVAAPVITPGGDRGPLRRRDRALQHVRRQPGGLRGGDGRPRRHRGRGPDRRTPRRSARRVRGDPGGGGALPGDRRCPGAGADDRRGSHPRRGSKAPAPPSPGRVQNGMRERGVLVGTTGRAGSAAPATPWPPPALV